MTRIEEVITRLQTFLGPVQCDLEFSNPYELTVATILSAQSTDAKVNKLTPALFARWPDFAALAAAEQAELAAVIKPAGLAQRKSGQLISLAQAVAARFGGELPRTRRELTTLPGIGNKTASVILSEAFGIPAIAVDTHVMRLAARLALSPAQTPDAIMADLEAGLAPADYHRAHLLLVHFGRYYCTARQMACGGCPLWDLCREPNKKSYLGK